MKAETRESTVSFAADAAAAPTLGPAHVLKANCNKTAPLGPTLVHNTACFR